MEDRPIDDEAQLLLEWRLTRLNFRFFAHLDRREYEAAAELIAPAGVINFSAGTTRGRDEFLAYVRQWPDLTVRHAVTNLVYDEVTEDSARGEGLLVVFVGPPSAEGAGAPAKHATEPHLAEIHDRYERIGDAWLIAERTFKNLLLSAASA
jgi:hypothetical protein